MEAKKIYNESNTVVACSMMCQLMKMQQNPQ